MNQALVSSSDPEATIAIPKQLPRSELSLINRQWVWLRLSIDESLDSVLPSDQNCAIAILTQRTNSICFTRQRIEFRLTRSPTPNPVLDPYPKIALAVLRQPDHCAAKGAVLSV